MYFWSFIATGILSSSATYSLLCTFQTRSCEWLCFSTRKSRTPYLSGCVQPNMTASPRHCSERLRAIVSDINTKFLKTYIAEVNDNVLYPIKYQNVNLKQYQHDTQQHTTQIFYLHCPYFCFALSLLLYCIYFCNLDASNLMHSNISY